MQSDQVKQVSKSFELRSPEEFFVNDLKDSPGRLGKIDLRPEPGTFSRKLYDYSDWHSRYKELERLEILGDMNLDDSLKRPEDYRKRFSPVTHLSPYYIKRMEAEARRNERLGIEGNNLADPGNPVHKTGFKTDKPVRAETYRIQKAIRRHGLAYDAVHNCGIYSCSTSPAGIKKNNKHGSCSLSGVATCGSVWACPVCRRKIMTRRAETIKKMSDHWVHNGGKLLMMTFTVPHTFKDSLVKIYGSSNDKTGLSGSLTRFRSYWAFSKDFKNTSAYFGDLRAVEVTHGRNGWHVHIHMLVFYRKDIPIDYYRKKLLEKWKKACLDSGLEKPNKHGLQIDKINATEAGEFSKYLAKWGAPNEVTSSYAKGAKNGNLTIAELERCLIDDFFRSWKKISLQEAGKILSLYYLSMKGQKMLQIGGCKKGFSWREDLLEELEQTDQKMNQDNESGSHWICTIDSSIVFEIGRRGLTFRLLDFAEKNGFTGVIEFIRSQGFSMDAIGRPPDLISLLNRTHNKLLK